jgi:hypothetical protein
MAAQIPPEIPFMIAPADVQDEELHDYRTAEGQKFYKAATAPFYDKTLLYDLSKEGLNGFLRCLKVRSFEYGTDSVLYIPDDVEAEEPELTHLCDRPDIPLTTIRAHVDQYLDAEGRDAQNSYLVYKMLSNSLNKDAQALLDNDADKWTIDGRGVGALYLKAIYSRVTIDAKADIRVLKNQLHHLTEYLTKQNGNIVLLNDHVKEIIVKLAKCGESSSDILEYLFTAYKTVTDAEFHSLVMDLDKDYHYKGVDITVAYLLEITSQFYKDQVESDLWKAPNDDQKKIIALQAQVSQTNKKMADTQQRLAHLQLGKSKDGKNPGKGKGKGKGKGGDSPSWINVPPSNGQPHTKVHNKHNYYWCAYHKRWSRNPKHTTATCKKIGINKDVSTTSSTNQSTASQVAHSYATVTTDDDQSY